jgi:hypothetical protein
MIINFQTVSDALVALGTIVGIAIVFAIAIIAAGALTERDKKRHARVAPAPHVMAQHPVEADHARELVLR